ncbi:hypothetical protein CRM22_002221 [Opisthorchis felineus]|uniref:NAD-dependent protein deacetylase n=1 Tax=Opisthorchis felineus TaxID=147828 RepID=A0A4S2M712_OPIFE|nr:hypothetical protein CRM22_002221 [Opisthorchis felineus]
MANFDLSSLKDALDSADNEPPKLTSVDLEGVAELIKSGTVKNIVTMAGAGISTAAGIPDFRSPKSGLYDNLGQYNLPYPMAVFTIDYFIENPEPFFKVAKGLYRPEAKPTLTHYFFRLLHEKGLLRRHYTQNVDDLERLTGLPEDKLIEAHGTFHTGHCSTCKKLYSLEFMAESVMNDKIPKCQAKSCDGVVKPDIVFFGEALPDKFHTNVNPDFSVCDLLIIIGTSLTVAPFCMLVDKVGAGVPRLYINREVPEMGLGCVPWDDPENRTDVFFRGDADDGVQRLSELLGWKEELLDMKRSTDATLGEVSAKRAGTEKKSSGNEPRK